LDLFAFRHDQTDGRTQKLKMSKSLESLAPQGMREIISVFNFCKTVRIGSQTDRTCTRTILTESVFTSPLSGGIPS